MSEEKGVEKIFSYRKVHEKGTIPPEIVDGEVEEALQSFFKLHDLKITITPKSQYYSHHVIVKRKDTEPSEITFTYSCGQSLMFRAHVKTQREYGEYREMFNKIAKKMNLKSLKPFPKDAMLKINSHDKKSTGNLLKTISQLTSFVEKD